MKASDLSSNACIVLELLSDGKPHTAKAMSAQLEMKRTTLRNALQRMDAFGLITMTELEKNRFEYQITPEGKTTITRKRMADRVQKTGMTPMPPAKPHVQSIIQEQMQQQPNVVEWLRSMAVSFNTMADLLA